MTSRLALAALLAAGLAACASAPPARHGARAVSPDADMSAERTYLAKAAKVRHLNVLPGIEYEVLKSGPSNGEHPKRSDDVTVRYQGRLISGLEFSSSPDHGVGVVVFPVQKLIPGWIVVLQLMRPGDEWQVYVPANLAYGAQGKGDRIPPDATLVFRIELVASGPHVDTPTEN
jgi:peptidylprolyl isomerase/FKBP-type peptidyl-prolyl cis-trans isomerase FklB